MFLSGGIASVAAVSVIVVLCVLTLTVAASWAVLKSVFNRFVEVLVNVLPLLFWARVRMGSSELI